MNLIIFNLTEGFLHDLLAWEAGIARNIKRNIQRTFIVEALKENRIVFNFFYRQEIFEEQVQDNVINKLK